MKQTVVVDTSVIVEYLRTGKGVLPKVYDTHTMVISTVSVVEIMASKTFADSSLEKEVEDFIHKYFKFQDVTEPIAHRAAKIMREHGVTLAVATIAATALEMNSQILTEDKKNFGKVDGLQMMETE